MSLIHMRILAISNELANNNKNFTPERMKALEAHEATLLHALSGPATSLEKREISRLLTTINMCQTMCLELYTDCDLDGNGIIGQK